MMENLLPSIALKDIDPEKCYWNPGCAMSLYRTDLPERMLKLLRERFCDVKAHRICCHHHPGLPAGSTIINNCAGCDRRFRSEYEGIQTISFWEVLDTMDGVAYPDYQGLTVSVHDSCSYRRKPQVHAAVRSVLAKMNIQIKESAYSGTKSICCGDNFYGHVPPDQVAALQKKRAAQMPCDDVVVYCIGCVRSMTVGGKRAHYLPDLLFGMETEPMHDTLKAYHDNLEAYIESH